MLHWVYLAIVVSIFEGVLAAPSATTALTKVILQSRQVDPSTVRRRALSSVNVPLQDYFNGTDLQYVSRMIRRIEILTSIIPGGSAE